MSVPIEPLSAEEVEGRYQDAKQYVGITKTTICELCESHERLRDKLSKAGWQPIDTAPKDGTTVFVWTGKAEFPSRYEASWRLPNDREWEVNGSQWPDISEGTFGPEPGWFADEYMVCKLDGEDIPTHWKPLPAPPKETA